MDGMGPLVVSLVLLVGLGRFDSEDITRVIGVEWKWEIVLEKRRGRTVVCMVVCIL